MSASCRIANSRLEAVLPRTDFASVACTQCLLFIYFAGIMEREKLDTQECGYGLNVCKKGRNGENCGCHTTQFVYNLPEYTADRNKSVPLRNLPYDYPESLLPEHFERVVESCCAAAASCCDTVLHGEDPHHDGAECPATWDGWQCHPRSPVGISTSICPHYIDGQTGVKQIEGVFKECTPYGWGRYYSADENRSWEHTQYERCADDGTTKFWAGVLSYAVSVVALIPAIAIISLFRTLRTQPVFVIHKHLLISFLLLGVFYLITSFLFIIKNAPLMGWHSENHVLCRLLFLVQLRFLRLSTFSWMLAEGVYLFRLLYKSFSDSESLIVYKIVCWGFPLLTSVAYGLLRWQFDEGPGATGCWVSPSMDMRLESVIMIPSLFCITLNLILVTVILYILVKKLRYNPHLEPMQYRRPPLFAIIVQGGLRLASAPPRRDSWLRSALANGRHGSIADALAAAHIAPDILVVVKAVRAALMLVPVFGLHFLFTIYRVNDELHQTMNLVMDGLQGFAVSIILCYANNGVGEAVKRYIREVKDMRSLRSEVRSQSNVGLGTRTSIPNGRNKISIHEAPEGKRESQDYRQPLMTTTEEANETHENSM